MTTLTSDAAHEQLPFPVHPIPDLPQRMRITPEIAADWLQNRNFSLNRKLSDHIAAKWARSMTAGRWRFTHQGIAFDHEGWLIDGQHRLRAVILSGVTVDMFVVPGCDPDTFSLLDSGHKRQAAHMLRRPNATQITSAARVLAAVLNLTDSPKHDPVYAGQLETYEVLTIVEQWPELGEFAAAMDRCYKHAQVSRPMHLAVLAQAARSSHADRIASWVDGIAEGACLEPTDPRLLLRNRFTKDSRLLNSPLKRKVCYSLIAKAWNAHAIGRPMGVLKVGDTDGIVRVID